MLHRPTTFVIGAGASRDFGFPVGSGLADKIASDLNLNFEYNRLTSGSLQIYEATKRAIEGISNQVAFDLCHQIRKGLVHYDSIDDYVEAASNNNVSIAAKISIFEVIGLAERKSSLAQLGTHENSKFIAGLRESWPAQLLRLALRGG